MPIKISLTELTPPLGGRGASIFIYPTDTAYAIGCDFRNQAAIKKIMAIKGRKDPKFTVIASSLFQVEKFFKFNKIQRKLAKKYWPGPLSIVVSRQFAVRVPNQPIARQLARAVGAPIIATSFNKSGQPENYSLKNTIIPPDVMVLNIGTLPKQKPSTVVECINNKIIVHRQGKIRPLNPLKGTFRNKLTPPLGGRGAR